jgi:DNA-binding transcriptional ArsR family regulator
MARSSRGPAGSPDRTVGVPGDQVPDQGLLAEAAETFTLLASPTRVHLLWLLARGEQDVGSLADAVRGSAPMVSQHLAKLRLAGLVSARRDGKRQVYVVDDPHVVSLIEQAIDHHAQLRGRR